jgi:hypothetical protein
MKSKGISLVLVVLIVVVLGSSVGAALGRWGTSLGAVERNVVIVVTAVIIGALSRWIWTRR